MSLSHQQCHWVIDEKISDRIINSDDEFQVHTTCDQRSSDSSIMLIYWESLNSFSLLNIKSCIYIKDWKYMRIIRMHSLLLIKAKHQIIAIACLYQQFIQCLHDINQFKSRIELLNTITLYFLIICIFLSLHISLLNE